jgi:type III secretion system chaperone SycN
MTAPTWIESTVGEFGRAAGLGSLSLGDRGVAALSFQNGLALRFEYAFDSLYVAMTVSARLDAAAAGRLLGYAHPNARLGFRIRTGYLAKSGRAVFAIRLAGRDVTLPSINAAFALLWRVALEFGGAA